MRRTGLGRSDALSARWVLCKGRGRRPFACRDSDVVTDRELLGGRYRLLDPVGDGGMASVFRAEDERLARIVAVKILHQRHLGEHGFVRRFEQEARLIAALSHPNIVTIHDFGHDDDAYYIVMEYVDGGSLRDLMTREGPLPLERVRDIARQLGLALDATHAQGVVHRDIKPDNILLGANDQVKISDFGIARGLAQPRQTATGFILGSAGYLSPEQARGQAATIASDIYSTGIVLYEMLLGSPPFMADSPLATALCHITQQPAPLSGRVPSLPPEAAAAVLRALNKDPDRRFPSASALAAALDPPTGRRQPPDEPTAAVGAPLLAPPSAPSAPRRHTAQPGAALRPRWRRSFLALPLVGVVGAMAVYYAGLSAPVSHPVAGHSLAPTRAGRAPSRILGAPASPTPLRLSGGGGPAAPPAVLASATAAPTASSTAEPTRVINLATAVTTVSTPSPTVSPRTATPVVLLPAQPVVDQSGGASQFGGSSQGQKHRSHRGHHGHKHRSQGD